MKNITMLFIKKPKSYYGIFSFFFKSNLYWLFFVYISLVLAITGIFSIFYIISYAGPEHLSPEYIKWHHKWYYSLTTFISPGFTEFLPVNDGSRLLSSINGLIGLSFNALFLSLLIARALQAHAPFDIVPFLLYDPETKFLSARFYSTLPSSCYNLSFRMFRFLIYENQNSTQMGSTREIKLSPEERNVLVPNYGILLRAEIDSNENSQHASAKNTHTRKKVPIEWVLPGNKNYSEGHFYITIEAETVYGKMFQTIDFYFEKGDLKVGRHNLLNEGKKLSLKNWYNWRKYRWDLWGSYSKMAKKEKYKDDLIFNRYY